MKALDLYGLRDAHKGVLTNIGVLLLHRSPHDYIPGAQIRIGIFDESGKEIEAPIAISGSLTSQLRDAIDALYDIHLLRALRMQTADAKDIAALRKPSDACDDRSEPSERQEAIVQPCFRRAMPCARPCSMDGATV